MAEVGLGLRRDDRKKASDSVGIPQSAQMTTLISDSDALAQFCARQKGIRFVAVDTEFMRERTYWPILCVVQVAGPGEAAAIDALAPGIELAPLLALMVDPEILKVFHAARQDLALHRLGAPAAERSADRICPRRCRPSAHRLRAAAAAARQKRPRRLVR